MDERQMQRKDRSSQGVVRLHPSPSHGMDASGCHEHEALVAEGYYRCRDCRRADLRDRAGAPARMR